MPGVKFTILESRCVPLPVENIDTDQIIPARYLTTTSREGLGKNLFHDWRYDKNGEPVKDFVLNNSQYSGSILAAGKNFGCGSSREHAVWALYDYGFRAIVSSYFADIFRNNALNNGLLPVTVPRDFLERLFDLLKRNPETLVRIDLEQQLLEVPCTGENVKFDINTWKKECLLNGMDNIDYLLELKPIIEQFEKNHSL